MRGATRTGVVRDEGGTWRQWVGADDGVQVGDDEEAGVDARERCRHGL